MSSRGDGQASGFTKDGLEVLPLKPPFAHEAIARLERLDAHFGAAGQLEAVKGLVPAKCLEIAIIDLSGIPPPDPATARTTDILAWRKTLSEQRSKLQQRENIVYDARNGAYKTLLAMCTPLPAPTC